MDETSVFTEPSRLQPTTPPGGPDQHHPSNGPTQVQALDQSEMPTQVHAAHRPEGAGEPAGGPGDGHGYADPGSFRDSGQFSHMQPGPVTTGSRADLFDRVPRQTLGIVLAGLSLAAIGAIAFFAFGGDDGEETATGIGSETQTEAGETDGPDGPRTADSSNDGRSEDTSGGRGVFDRGDGSTETTADPNGTTSTTDRSTSSSSSPTTERDTTTTTERDTTTTERDTTTTTERDTTTTERETTTTETTAPPPTETPVDIVSSARITHTGPTSFAFEYTTNNVCSTGSFSVSRTSDGQHIGSFTGDDVCYGPVHGGFPQASHPVFGGYNLEPGTTYTVRATVRGTASDGSRPAGSGSDSISFQVTTSG